MTLPVVQKLPTGHGSHWLSLERSVLLECVPERHGSAEEAPGGQKLPARHVSHAVAPMSRWNLPPRQAAHAESPAACVYVPALHGCGRTLPARHASPAWQVSHCAVLTRPVLFDHLPGGQAVAIALPAGHAWPAGHSSVCVVASVGQSSPAGHEPAQRAPV